jgi:hypothetical protein
MIDAVTSSSFHDASGIALVAAYRTGSWRFS